ncbi:hypothetical protein [Roseibium alexandrii]|uniref:hypothetical protein n=1 Tax=Roseibium alexandrii TaxID=388408 RepID=UPI0037509FF0
MSVSTKPQCAATTLKGNRCRNSAAVGEFCNIHSNKLLNDKNNKESFLLNTQDYFRKIDIFVFAKAIFAVSGLSLTYLTGLISYVGLDFAQLFSLSALIEAVSTAVMYFILLVFIGAVLYVFFGWIYVFWEKIIRILMWPFVLFVQISSLDRFFSYVKYTTAFTLSVIISIYLLATHIGPFLSGAMTVIIVPFAIWVSIIIRSGPFKIIEQPFAVIVIFALVFQIGYSRAFYMAQEPFRFILYDKEGERSCVNILFSAPHGSLFATQPFALMKTRTSGFMDEDSLPAVRYSLENNRPVFIYVPIGNIKAIEASRNLQTEWEQLIYFGDYTAGFLSLFTFRLDLNFFSKASAGVGTSGGNDFSSIKENITTNISGLPGILSGLAYMFGVLLAVLGVLKIKDHVQNPAQNRIYSAHGC